MPAPMMVPLDRGIFVAMQSDPVAQKAHYDEFGFVLLPKVIGDTEVAAILTAMAEIKASRSAPNCPADWQGAFDYQHMQCGTQYSAGATYGSWPPSPVENLITNPTVLATARNIFSQVRVNLLLCNSLPGASHP